MRKPNVSVRFVPGARIGLWSDCFEIRHCTNKKHVTCDGTKIRPPSQQGAKFMTKQTLFPHLLNTLNNIAATVDQCKHDTDVEIKIMREQIQALYQKDEE